MKLSQRLDLVVLFLLSLYILSGCTMTEVAETLATFELNAPSPTTGCGYDELLWCEGHDRTALDCQCVDRRAMERAISDF